MEIIKTIKEWLSPVDDFLNKAGDFLAKNPIYFGLLIIVVGVLFVIGAKRNWNWVMEGKYWVYFTKVSRNETEELLGEGATKRISIRAGLYIILGGIYFIIYGLIKMFG